MTYCKLNDDVGGVNVKTVEGSEHEVDTPILLGSSPCRGRDHR